MPLTGDERLNRRRLLSLLGEVEAARGDAVSFYLPSGCPADEIAELAAGVPGLELALPDLAQFLSSPAGAVVLWGEPYHLVVLPPFPIKEKAIFAGYFIDPLKSLLETEFTIGILLLRLGAYALGVFEGEKLVSSKVGTGLVHARHRQGGSSAARFRRHREKQAESFFGRVCGHMREHFVPYLGKLDFLVYGGEKFTLVAFQKECAFNGQLAERILPYSLDIRHPKQATLEAAITQVWTSRVIRWQAPDF